jgi:hypothetical protein
VSCESTTKAVVTTGCMSLGHKMDGDPFQLKYMIQFWIYVRHMHVFIYFFQEKDLCLQKLIIQMCFVASSIYFKI